jgi:hypothetical protein
MDDWQRKLAREIVAETPTGTLPDGEATLEVAFGDARAAVTYALEIARAHRLPATGSVVADQLWMRLGDGKVRLTLNRRVGAVEVDVSLPGAATSQTPKETTSEMRVVRWKEAEHKLVDDRGSATDLGELARSAIDAIVADYRARPPSEKKQLSSAPPPDLEDTPTRG